MQEIHSTMLIHPVMKQVKYLCESLNHSFLPLKEIKMYSDS